VSLVNAFHHLSYRVICVWQRCTAGFCQFDHPCPVGSNCIFQTWFRVEEMSTTETPVSGGIPVITAASADTNLSLAVPVSAQAPAISLPSEPLNVNPPDEGICLSTSEPAPLQREDVLNSTTQSEAPSRGSRGSNCSRL
jgi:hypothetical protein